MNRLPTDLASQLAVIVLLWLCSARVEAQIILPPGLGAEGGGQTVPTAGYDLALATLAAGDVRTALEIAMREYQSCIKIGTQRWIDSIAAATAVGECQYELGDLRAAVVAYNEALLLSATHADWLLAVQFPDQPLQPLRQQRPATWGQSQRNTLPAAIPGTMSIRRGGSDPQQVLQKGGVLSSPVLYPVRPQEIMRAIVIALYRRHEILGELSPDGSSLAEAAQALGRRPAPPNHYSQSWIDIALGTALWSQGKSDQALPLLNRGLLVGNQFDHPLTAWGLIVLGRIALNSDQAAAAAKLFEEATYSAADYGDARALEEAFALAFTAHAVAGSRDVPPSIRVGAEWARNNLPTLRARLLAMQAECLANAGNVREAKKTLADIDPRLLRGDLGRGACGAQADYAAAIIAYKINAPAEAEMHLSSALAKIRPRSPRLFQTQRLVELVTTGSSAVSDRQADALFARLIGVSNPEDFVRDPLGMLAVTTAPRREAFAAWLMAASRRGNDALLMAIESSIGSRWLTAQPLGGRRIAIENLIAADPDALPAEAAARRAALLVQHPELTVALNKLTQVRTSLTAALVAQAAGNAGGGPLGDPLEWGQYAQQSRVCALLAASIAAGRDPTVIDFPPLTPAAEIRRRLAAKQFILSFHWTGAGLLAAFESHDRTVTWNVQQPAVLAKEIATLAKSIGIFDPVAPVSAERFGDTQWRAVAGRIAELLFENSKVSLQTGIDELVIVPDGLLWYLPFELLPVESGRGKEAAEAGAEQMLLRETCRIRYCPTRSLAVGRFKKLQPNGILGLYAGKMFRSDRPDAAQETVARLARSLDRALPLSPLAGGGAATASGGAPVPLVASLLDTLVVVEELVGTGSSASRSLVNATGGKGGMTVADWLAPPAKRPRCVVLPGWQTSMASGLAKIPPQPGEDLFLTVTDLLAAGAQTALISRWNVGGKVSVDLVDEFLRDLSADATVEQSLNAFSTAPKSWRRAVDLIVAEPPELAREPRIKPSSGAAISDARHPFFWAGYLLVDCGQGAYSAEPLPAAARNPPPVVPPARAGRPAPVVAPPQAAPPQAAPPQAAP